MARVPVKGFAKRRFNYLTATFIALAAYP